MKAFVYNGISFEISKAETVYEIIFCAVPHVQS